MRTNLHLTITTTRVGVIFKDFLIIFSKVATVLMFPNRKTESIDNRSEKIDYYATRIPKF